MCDRRSLASEFGSELNGVAGMPEGVTLRCGVDGGNIVLIAHDTKTGKHVELLVESDLSIALNHLIRARAH